MEPFSSPAHRPAVINNQLGQPQTTDRSQRRVNVSHEDLRARVGVVTPSVPEVFVYPLTPRCSQRPEELHLDPHYGRNTVPRIGPLQTFAPLTLPPAVIEASPKSGDLPAWVLRL